MDSEFGREIRRGESVRIAQQRVAQFRILWPVLRLLPFSSTIQGVLELAVAFWLYRRCEEHHLCLWLFGDAAYCITAFIVNAALQVKLKRVMLDADMQTYLIRKYRDGATDPEMEAKMPENCSGTVLAVLNLFVISSGIWMLLHFMNECGTFAVMVFIVLKLALPMVVGGCCVCPAVTALFVKHRDVFLDAD